MCNHDGKQYSGSSKIKTKTTVESSNPTTDYMSRRIENWVSERYLHIHVHSSFVHNSPLFINGWMYKQNVMYTYNEILFGFKKEVNSAICCTMGEPWGCYAKWNKPVTKKTNTTIIPLSEVSKVVKFIKTESRMMITGR